MHYTRLPWASSFLIAALLSSVLKEDRAGLPEYLCFKEIRIVPYVADCHPARLGQSLGFGRGRILWPVDGWSINAWSRYRCLGRKRFNIQLFCPVGCQRSGLGC